MGIKKTRAVLGLLMYMKVWASFSTESVLTVPISIISFPMFNNYANIIATQVLMDLWILLTVLKYDV